MKTTISNKLLSRTLFFSTVFFITVFFSDGYSGLFFLNRNYRIIKYALCVLVPVITVCFNFAVEKSLNFIGKSSAVIMSCFVAFFILFHLLKVGQFRFSEMASINHIAYAMVCVFSVFGASTFLAVKNRGGGYPEFYNDFFLGYVPMMIMLYCLFYFGYRMSVSDYTVNLIPFRGEIKRFFSSDISQTFVRTIGNIAYYSTLSLTAARFIKKHTAFVSFLAPFAVCVLTELAQGIFNIGDADVDDIILNGLGALIGALLYSFAIRDLRSEKSCLE